MADPIHTGGPVPHWSRWEKSATTLGPWGRVALTIAFFLTLPVAFSMGMFMYLILFPVFGVVVLSGIWAKGWVVPSTTGNDVRPALTPERPEPHPEPAMTKVMLAWRIAWVGAVLAGCVIFAYAPSVAAKAAVLAGATIAGVVLLWRGFLSR